MNRIYIVDPLGNLMMSYEPNVNPRDIYTDLKEIITWVTHRLIREFEYE